MSLIKGILEGKITLSCCKFSLSNTSTHYREDLISHTSKALGYMYYLFLTHKHRYLHTLRVEVYPEMHLKLHFQK